MRAAPRAGTDAMSEETRLMIFGLLVAAGFGLGGFAILGLILAALKLRVMNAREKKVARWAIGVAIAGVLCVLYGRIIEVDWLSETHVVIETKKLAPNQRVRIVHLTDLHVVRAVPVLEELVPRVNAL